MTRPDARALFRDARARALALLAAPPPLLVVTDFDGTLAPISLDPMGAVIEPIARRALRRLAGLAERRPGRVVVTVLSGRLAADVAGRVRVGGLGYLGNHGLEGGRLRRRGRAEALAVAPEPGLEPWLAAATAVADRVATSLGGPAWLFVERKGPTVAFHFRQAPDPDAARIAVIAAIEAAERSLGGTGLIQVEGRIIVELRPEVAGGKGRAIQRLLARERPGGVLVLGDDVSDAEAFRAVRAARDRGTVHGLAVAVHAAAETPPAVGDAADVELAQPRDAARLLSAVASALDRETAASAPRRRRRRGAATPARSRQPGTEGGGERPGAGNLSRESPLTHRGRRGSSATPSARGFSRSPGRPGRRRRGRPGRTPGRRSGCS